MVFLSLQLKQIIFFCTILDFAPFGLVEKNNIVWFGTAI